MQVDSDNEPAATIAEILKNVFCRIEVINNKKFNYPRDDSVTDYFVWHSPGDL